MYQPASIVALTATVTFAPGARLASSISAVQWTGSWAWALPVRSAVETASADANAVSDILFDIISLLLYSLVYQTWILIHHSIPNFFSSARIIGIEMPYFEIAPAILPSGSMM